MNAIKSILILSFILLADNLIYAHCDSYAGPVVTSARRALETQNVRLVLIWVKQNDEHEIEEAFRKTLAVRKLSPEAKVLADKSFFETVVRLHRAGEGEPYTGLKSADFDIGKAIPAADKAIDTKDNSALRTMLLHDVNKTLDAYFKHVLETKHYDPNDVEKGREFVAAYVAFTHFVERISAASGQLHGNHLEDQQDGHSH